MNWADLLLVGHLYGLGSNIWSRTIQKADAFTEVRDGTTAVSVLKSSTGVGGRTQFCASVLYGHRSCRPPVMKVGMGFSGLCFLKNAILFALASSREEMAVSVTRSLGIVSPMQARSWMILFVVSNPQSRTRRNAMYQIARTRLSTCTDNI